MSLPNEINPQLLASSAGGYNLTRSLRLRSSASAYLSRTPASNGNRQIFTFSFWVKRGALSVNQDIYFTNAGGGTFAYLSFSAGNAITFASVTFSVADIDLTSTPVYRDPSAWYHIVLQVDTTQATNTNRVRIYVNGAQITVTGTYPAQNYNCQLNTTTAQSIGRPTTGTLDGYLAEFNFIDGQALTPSSFGEFSTKTGVWQPIEYAGTYGTNGFYLPFTNNSTTTTLGNDFSGNSNNWTTNNISLTAGSTYDSMTDVPTLTSATAANYCVINGLNIGGDCTISQANLTVAYGSNTTRSPMQGTIGMTTGKWYFEAVCTASSVSPTSNLFVGIANKTMPSELGSYTGANANGWGFNSNGGTIYNNGSSSAYGSSASVNDIVGVAFDADTGKLYFSINGTFQNSGNPATGTNPAYTVSADTYYPSIGDGSGASTLTASINFGQRPFEYTPPTGFVALNTFNLPTPTIGATASTQANKYFDATTYTGTGSTQSITNSGAMQPDFIWFKDRTQAASNALFDSVRGRASGLSSNLSDAQYTSSAGNDLVSFDSSGFTVGTVQNWGSTNNSTKAIVAWQWNAGGSTVTNTSGSISAQVRANPTAGFSVVTYTGNGSAGATVGHGLGVAPAMLIVKNRSSVSNWPVYTKALNSTKFLLLNTTAAEGTSSINWNNTNPTSSVFSIGTSARVNASSENYVAYCFSEVAGYSKFGSYTGNGSSDGTFVYTGFRPRYIMIKKTDEAGYDWWIFDSSRNTYNVVSLTLAANLNNSEETFGSSIDFTSNGFKFRVSYAGFNANGGNYIYMAFAETPFKYSLAR
jgi:hypothetical protein